MRILFIVVLLCQSSVLFSQKKKLLQDCSSLDYQTNTDSLGKRVDYVFKLEPSIHLIINYRDQEYFVPSDTLHRDIILTDANQFELDKLQGLTQSNYTGGYDLLYSHSLDWKGDRYCILSFVNTFFYGTNQNVFFVIFKLDGIAWQHFGSYENEADKPIEDIKVKLTRKEIKLKGKYLSKIKR